jgi:hypothetical protein
MMPVYSSPEPEDDESKLDELDMEALAEKIVDMLLRELEVESERTGR